MSTATAWAALQDALTSSVPSCEGDPRFTAETSEHDAALRKICAGCPVREQCRDFAKVAPRNQTWGYFGGIIRRTTPQIRERRSAKTPRSSVSQLAS